MNMYTLAFIHGASMPIPVEVSTCACAQYDSVVLGVCVCTCITCVVGAFVHNITLWGFSSLLGTISKSSEI